VPQSQTVILAFTHQCDVSEDLGSSRRKGFISTDRRQFSLMRGASGTIG
jgi:hypothetical protein